jgi:hypothetical protein
MAVNETLEAAGFERIIELVCELQVVAAVGDKDAELLFVGRGGPVCLRQSDTSGLRRSSTGCVMRKVCHSTAPMRCRLTTNINIGKRVMSALGGKNGRL